MKVLIACEESGVVRDAFAKRGHNAWSCDLKPSRNGGKHLQCDVLQIINNGWDLMVGHPPCDFLSCAGNEWFANKYNRAGPTILTGEKRVKAMHEALAFVKALWNAPIAKICLENPKGRLSTLWMKPTQIVCPFNFGHGHTKKTCLWLKNLPLLTPPDFKETPVLEKVDWKHLGFAQDLMWPSENRKRELSVTFSNIAFAMATQWG